MARALVTGGAGFIGSHLVDRLVDLGHEVTVVDNLHEWSHKGKPDYLNQRARYVFGNIGDPLVLKEALHGMQVVYHLAAVLGLEASQREPATFVRENSLATATLFHHLSSAAPGSVERVVTASSNTVYGEGPGECPSCKRVLVPESRSLANPGKGTWEPLCPDCCTPLVPRPTKEDHPRRPASVYALTKLDQEELTLELAPHSGIRAVVVRFFNVYGPRQSPTNPYAGVISIFRGRALAGQRPLVYEDGHQSRDFVSVHDVVEAMALAGSAKVDDPTVVNAGTGKPTEVLSLAEKVLELSGSSLTPAVQDVRRAVDVRHSFADMTRATTVLGYRPKVMLEDGLRELFQGPTPQ